jgi:hydroxyethylthiazole kinase-like sugar kinase family protein
VGTVSVSLEFYGLPAALIYGTPPKAWIFVQISGADVRPGAVSLPVGTTKEQAAGLVAAALDKEQDAGKTVTLNAVAAGATVTVTEGSGAVITLLTARVT